MLKLGSFSSCLCGKCRTKTYWNKNVTYSGENYSLIYCTENVPPDFNIVNKLFLLCITNVK